MTSDEIRHLLARALSGESNFSWQLTSPDVRLNWRTHADHVIKTLADNNLHITHRKDTTDDSAGLA